MGLLPTLIGDVIFPPISVVSLLLPNVAPLILVTMKPKLSNIKND